MAKKQTKKYAAFLKELKDIGAVQKTKEPIATRPTGIMSLDLALHGGLPLKKWVLIYGDKGNGKTTIAKLIAGSYQSRGLYTLWLDNENSFNPEYAQLLGVDPYLTDEDGRPYIDVFNAETSEIGWEAIRTAIESGLYNLIVIDTIAKLVPREEMEGSMDKGHMAPAPRINALATRVMGPLLENSDCTILALNQERMDLGTYGAPRISPGGKALGHEAWIEMYMKRKDIEEKDGEVTHITFHYTFKKSKGFPYVPSRVYDLPIACTRDKYRPDFAYELFILADQYGLLVGTDGQRWKKNNAYFEGELLGNGQKKSIQYISDTPDLRERLKEAVFERMKNGARPTEVVHETEDSDAGYGEQDLEIEPA